MKESKEQRRARLRLERRAKMTLKQLAQSNFMEAFWDDPKRHRRISLAHRMGWQEYRDDPRYPALHEALKATY